MFESKKINVRIYKYILYVAHNPKTVVQQIIGY